MRLSFSGFLCGASGLSQTFELAALPFLDGVLVMGSAWFENL